MCKLSVCKNCGKHISDVEYIRYGGVCADCWHMENKGRNTKKESASTMTLNINNHTLTLTAKETENGAILIASTDKGECCYDGFSSLYDDGNDGIARMLFEILAPLGEAEQYPTFRAWCDFMDYMGDDFSPRNENCYNEWRDSLDEWRRMADGLSCDETLTYLSNNFNI